MPYSYRSFPDDDRELLPESFWKVIITTLLLTSAFLKSTELFIEYLSQRQDNLIAIDARTGKVAWSIPLSDRLPPDSFVVTQPGRVYAGSSAEDDRKGFQIQAFNEFSGDKLWNFKLELSMPVDL